MNRLWIAAILWLAGFAVMLLAICFRDSDFSLYAWLGSGVGICILGAVLGVASVDDPS